MDDKFYKPHFICGQILAEFSKDDKDTKRIELAIRRLAKGKHFVN